MRLTSTSVVKRCVVVYPKEGNYELNFRRIKEESTDGSGSVCHVEFYVISYVLGVCGPASGREGSYRKLDAACIADDQPVHSHMSTLIPTGYLLQLGSYRKLDAACIVDDQPVRSHVSTCVHE